MHCSNLGSRESVSSTQTEIVPTWSNTTTTKSRLPHSVVGRFTNAISKCQTNKVVKLLQECGEDLLALTDPDGGQILSFAVNRSNDEILGLLLQYGLNVNHADKDGLTALHWSAVSNKKMNKVRLLVQYGGNVNQQNKQGNTPLYIACLNCCEKVVQLLVANCASSTLKNVAGKSPLSLCQTKNNQVLLNILGMTNIQLMPHVHRLNPAFPFRPQPAVDTNDVYGAVLSKLEAIGKTQQAQEQRLKALEATEKSRYSHHPLRIPNEERDTNKRKDYNTVEKHSRQIKSLNNNVVELQNTLSQLICADSRNAHKNKSLSDVGNDSVFEVNIPTERSVNLENEGHLEEATGGALAEADTKNMATQISDLSDLSKDNWRFACKSTTVLNPNSSKKTEHTKLQTQSRRKEDLVQSAVDNLDKLQGELFIFLQRLNNDKSIPVHNTYIDVDRVDPEVTERMKRDIADMGCVDPEVTERMKRDIADMGSVDPEVTERMKSDIADMGSVDPEVTERMKRDIADIGFVDPEVTERMKRDIADLGCVDPEVTERMKRDIADIGCVDPEVTERMKRDIADLGCVDPEVTERMKRDIADIGFVDPEVTERMKRDIADIGFVDPEVTERMKRDIADLGLLVPEVTERRKRELDAEMCAVEKDTHAIDSGSEASKSEILHELAYSADGSDSTESLLNDLQVQPRLNVRRHPSTSSDSGGSCENLRAQARKVRQPTIEEAIQLRGRNYSDGESACSIGELRRSGTLRLREYTTTHAHATKALPHTGSDSSPN